MVSPKLNGEKVDNEDKHSYFYHNYVFLNISLCNVIWGRRLMQILLL